MGFAFAARRSTSSLVSRRAREFSPKARFPFSYYKYCPPGGGFFAPAESNPSPRACERMGFAFAARRSVGVGALDDPLHKQSIKKALPRESCRTNVKLRGVVSPRYIVLSPLRLAFGEPPLPEGEALGLTILITERPAASVFCGQSRTPVPTVWRRVCEFSPKARFRY